MRGLVSWQEGDQSSPWEPGEASEGAPSAGTRIPDCQPLEPSVVEAPSLWHMVPVAGATTPSKHVSWPRGSTQRTLPTAGQVCKMLWCLQSFVL